MEESRPQIEGADEAASGEPLEGSGFEAETPVDFDQAEAESEEAAHG